MGLLAAALQQSDPIVLSYRMLDGEKLSPLLSNCQIDLSAAQSQTCVLEVGAALRTVYAALVAAVLVRSGAGGGESEE